jgi:adenosylcobinamide-phosphate synthase
MLAAALILDALVGEPPALWSRSPHPVVLLGRLVGWLDRRLNTGPDRRRNGVLAVLALLLVALPLPLLIAALPFGWVLEVLGAAILLAQRSLAEHVGAVADALDGSLAEGRGAVARIVGRDPGSLDRAGVARAAVESAAENFSDGVVAPAFWFAVGGLPGIVLYKAVNTADSMIGHRTPRYLEFGRAAARLDDALNWIPARLAGLLICLAGLLPRLSSRALGTMWRDARLHRSPNAGWPEAATAAVLGLALAGPRIYGGVLTDDAYLNAEGNRDAMPDDIRRAVALVWRAWGLLLALAVLGGLLALG